MIIPNVGMKGTFEFLAPFNKDDLQKKILEVTSIRNLSELYNNQDNPEQKIYISNGLTKEDYYNDLQANIPVAVFSAPGGMLYYIPCNRISNIPSVSGVPYERKVVAVSLGNMPQNYSFDTVLEDIRTVVKTRLAIDPVVEIMTASAPAHKTYEEHEQFETFMQTNPILRGSKSYKTKYLELLEKHQALVEKHKNLTQFMINTWANNVVQSNRPTPNDLLTYTKKIKVEFVSNTTKTKGGICKLLFNQYNSFNLEPRPVYASSFTKQNDNLYYGMLGKAEMTMTVKTGNFKGQNLPDLFSETKSIFCQPNEAPVIELELSEPLNLRSYSCIPYIDNDVYSGKVRITLYNESGSVINIRVYTYGALTGDFTPEQHLVESGSLNFQETEDNGDVLFPPE